MLAYCVKCKAKKEISEAQEVITKRGTKALTGKCPDCGTKMFRFVPKSKAAPVEEQKPLEASASEEAKVTEETTQAPPEAPSVETGPGPDVENQEPPKEEEAQGPY